MSIGKIRKNQQQQHQIGITPIVSLLHQPINNNNNNMGRSYQSYHHEHHHHRLPLQQYRPTSIMYALLQQQESDQREKKDQDQQQQQQQRNVDDEDQKEDFSLKVGRAIDVLRKEYPYYLTQSPDYTLYDPEKICLSFDLPTSPFFFNTILSYSNNNLVGGGNNAAIKRYKMMWDMTHMVLSLLYNLDQSYMSSIKCCHDRVRGNIIRVQWHAILVPRWHAAPTNSGPTGTLTEEKSVTPTTTTTTTTAHATNTKNCHHIDGISIYEVDYTTGKIIQHRVEQVVYSNNQQPVLAEEQRLIMLLAQQQRQPVSTGVIGGGGGRYIPIQLDKNTAIQSTTISGSGSSPQTIVEFRPFMQTNNPFHHHPTSTLFAMEAEQQQPPSASVSPPVSSSSSTSSSSSSLSNVVTSASSDDDSSNIKRNIIIDNNQLKTIDMDAFHNKNKSRQKFGLQPLSIEEYIRIEQEVEQLASVQADAIRNAQSERQQLEEEMLESEKNGGPNIIEKMINSVVLKSLDTCESNYDCERPQVCCDYIFIKKCCTGGSLVGRNEFYNKQPRYALIPVYGGNEPPNNNDKRNY